MPVYLRASYAEHHNARQEIAEARPRLQADQLGVEASEKEAVEAGGPPEEQVEWPG